jgi:heme-degrading monooxygenase HmoA
MIVHMTIHYPKQGAEAALTDSMHRYGAALKDAPGLISVHTLRDERSGALVGLALWETEEARQASIHLARAAVANDPFDQWESRDVQGFLLEEV